MMDRLFESDEDVVEEVKPVKEINVQEKREATAKEERAPEPKQDVEPREVGEKYPKSDGIEKTNSDLKTWSRSFSKVRTFLSITREKKLLFNAEKDDEDGSHADDPPPRLIKLISKWGFGEDIRFTTADHVHQNSSLNGWTKLKKQKVDGKWTQKTKWIRIKYDYIYLFEDEKEKYASGIIPLQICTLETEAKPRKSSVIIRLRPDKSKEPVDMRLYKPLAKIYEFEVEESQVQQIVKVINNGINWIEVRKEQLKALPKIYLTESLGKDTNTLKSEKK